MDEFGLNSPWYRHHEAKLIQRVASHWGNVGIELVTREADRPCSGGMCLPYHTVSFLVEGRRSGLFNSIEGIAPRRVGHEMGWTRIVPAGRHVQTQWDRGRRTYLLAFVDPADLDNICARNGVAISQDLCGHIDLRDQHFARLLANMAQELLDPGMMVDEMGAALAIELCVYLLRLMRRNSTKLFTASGGLPQHKLSKVLETIESSLEEPPSVQELAAIAGLSVNHFAHAFRQTTGMPPYRYMLEARLCVARRLMADPALSITEIALRTGFASSSQFATAFRRATGLSPREWRSARNS